MSKRNKVLWEKWLDPFDTSNNKSEPDDDDDDEKSDYEALEEERYEGHGPIVGKFLASQFGVLPINENFSPSKLFNFWVCHTNFTITKPIMQSLNAIDGVEGLQIVSRYRFRIAIGRLFDEEEVKDNIRYALCGPEPSEEVLTLVMDLTASNEALTPELEEKVNKVTAEIPQEYWAVYVVPNGQLQILTGNAVDEEFAEKFRVFYEAQQAVGGAIITSLE